jgi:hypothetical protein
MSVPTQIEASTQLKFNGAVNFNSQLATGLADASSLTDAVNSETLQKQSLIYATDTGTANAYAVALTPAPSSYTAGMVVVFEAVHANTGASTLNVNSLGNKNITKFGSVALSSGDIAANQVIIAVYDGTEFQMLGPTGGSINNPVLNEVPSGSINGSNVTFTIAHTPYGGAISLFQNGSLRNPGGNDYSFSGTTITFITAPQVGDILLSNYFY